jgi:hypothetical protein
VRIGDAVEDEQQRRFGERVEHVVERDVGYRGVDDGDDALVPVRTGERTQTLVVGQVDRAANGFGARGVARMPSGRRWRSFDERASARALASRARRTTTSR